MSGDLRGVARGGGSRRGVATKGFRRCRGRFPWRQTRRAGLGVLEVQARSPQAITRSNEADAKGATLVTISSQPAIGPQPNGLSVPRGDRHRGSQWAVFVGTYRAARDIVDNRQCIEHTSRTVAPREESWHSRPDA